MAPQATLPLVSIGVPCYNRPQLLRRLLSQLVAQTYRNIEIVISDNCSPNRDVLAVAHQYSERDRRIRVFRQRRNVGLVPNHDAVTTRAAGKYFMWAHDDDEFPQNYVEICVRHLLENPSAVLVGPQGDRYLDGKYWLTYENYSSLGLNTFERLHNLMPDAFGFYWRFEQYFSGMFLLEAAPRRLSREFRTLFNHFFVLSERGPIIHAPELKLIKHTTQENLKRYATGELYRRHALLRQCSQELQECIPIAFQMLATIWRSRQLTYTEKQQLIQQWKALLVPLLRKEYWQSPRLIRAVETPRRLLGRHSRKAN
jgi:glycosyltransferase involved in cell wall biosynthesis